MTASPDEPGERQYDAVETTAVDACTAAGEYLRDAFDGATAPDGEYGPYDVKADADVEAERRALAAIEERFPGHEIVAEESGVRESEGEGEGGGLRWIVDPLDGTNDFAVGRPTFAVAIAVLDDEGPAVGAMYAPALDDLYVARRGDGVRLNGRQVRADSDVDLRAATVGFVIGHDVKHDPETARTAGRIREGLADRVKRVIPCWSPCFHWGLLARGLVDGMVCYRPDPEEQHLGELIAAESGAHTRRFPDGYVAATSERGRDAFAAVLADAARE